MVTLVSCIERGGGFDVSGTLSVLCRLLQAQIRGPRDGLGARGLPWWVGWGVVVRGVEEPYTVRKRIYSVVLGGD